MKNKSLIANPPDKAGENPLPKKNTETKEVTVSLKTMGKVFKKLREEKGLTQEELCKIAGIRKAEIVKLEGGDLNVLIKSIFSVAYALGADIRFDFKPKGKGRKQHNQAS